MKKSPPANPRRSALALTVVIGNSWTHAALWSAGGKLLRRAAWPTTLGAKQLAQAVRRLVPPRGRGRVEIVLSGVVPAAVKALEVNLRSTCLARAGCVLLRFRHDLPCPLDVAPRPASRVGDDRLAAALGALSHDPKTPWVVLDAGTALTVNAVRPGRFEGGLIVPGEELALRALNAGTAQLPAPRPWPPRATVPAIGCSTASAMRSGVRRAQIAAALALARAQAAELGPQTRLVLTGGGAPALWPALCEELAALRPLLDPDLVLRGLFAAWKST